MRTPGRSAFWSDGWRLLWSVTRSNDTVYRSIPPDDYGLDAYDADESRVWEGWRGPVDIGGEDVYLVFNAVRTTVAPDGFVRQYRFAHVVGDEDARVRVVRRVTYSAVDGTSIGRPGWYDRAVTDRPDAMNGPDAPDTTETPARRDTS